ncbi:hypothetical protein WJX77_007279 [Trebouxia sp. C0004]
MEMEHPLSLLTGCLTRWGSQVAAIIRLLQFRKAMRVVLFKSKDGILKTIAKKEQRDKAAQILATAKTDHFWNGLQQLLMAQSAPQLSKLAIYLFQIAVNSAAVESLFSAFGNIQTKRRNSIVHARVQKMAQIKATLPPKPRSASKAAGNRYLSAKASTRASKLSDADAQKQQDQATNRTEQQYVDGPADLLVEAQQLDQVVQEFKEQAVEADDADYANAPAAARCSIAALFVDMPEYDLNLLVEDDLEDAE